MSYLLLAEKQQLLLLQNAKSKLTKETQNDLRLQEFVQDLQHIVEMAARKPRGMRMRPQPRHNRTR